MSNYKHNVTTRTKQHKIDLNSERRLLRITSSPLTAGLVNMQVAITGAGQSVIIPMNIYCQSTVKRAGSHLPTVPPVALRLHGKRASRQRMRCSAVSCLKAYY